MSLTDYPLIHTVSWSYCRQKVKHQGATIRYLGEGAGMFSSFKIYLEHDTDNSFCHSLLQWKYLVKRKCLHNYVYR